MFIIQTIKVFPTIWKTYSIISILKVGDPSDVLNYRPIFILHHLTKIFELIIYDNIKRSLNHIIINEQHGFRPGKSAITSSVVFTTNIAVSLEDGYQNDLIVIDFKKHLLESIMVLNHLVLLTTFFYLDLNPILILENNL